MLYHDNHVSRQFAADRHTDLARDRRARVVRTSAPVEARAARRARLAWLRGRLWSPRRVPAGGAS